MDDRGRYYDAGAELPHSHQQDVIMIEACEATCQDGCKHSNRARDHNDEKQTSAQRDVVVSLRSGAASLDGVTMRVYAMSAFVSYCHKSHT